MHWIDVDNLFSWGPTADPFRALSRPPVLFSKVAYLASGPEPLMVICEPTPQAACIGAWITKVAESCSMETFLTFYGAKRFGIDLDIDGKAPGSMITVGIPIAQKEIIENMGAVGWKLYACPTTSSLDAMKVISRSLGYRNHICAVPWARVILPRRDIPAQYHKTDTGCAGFDAAVEAAGAKLDHQPVMRRKVRNWISKSIRDPDSRKTLASLMVERDHDLAKIISGLL